MGNGDFNLTHKKILEYGKIIFKEKGFEKANVREIFAKAGVTTGAFYGHFEDKLALFSELVQLVIDDVECHYSLLEKQSFTMNKKEAAITKNNRINPRLKTKRRNRYGVLFF